MTNAPAPIRRAGEHRRPAFSLLELVLVLVIMGVAAAIAVPRYAAALARYRAETCARRIAADLEQARDAACRTSGDQTIVFNPAAECYTFTGRDDPDRPGQPYTVPLAGDPYRADLVGAAFGAGAAVTFNGFGVPADGGTVTVQSGGYAWTVTVDGESGEVTTNGP
jgi:type II secretion system protein H